MNEKKVAIITGASRGIGAAISNRLAMLNYDLILLARNEKELKKVKKSCEKNGIYVKTIPCDMSTKEDLENIINFITKKITRVDLLVNNAGIGIFGPIENFELEDWDHIVDLNLKAPFFLIRAVVPIMKRQCGGQIINISSDADSMGFSEASIYCASKAGLLGLSQALSLELRKSKIKICTISPGRVDTYFNSKKPGDREGALDSDDIAKLVVDIMESSHLAMIKSVRMDSIYSIY